MAMMVVFEKGTATETMLALSTILIQHMLACGMSRKYFGAITDNPQEPSTIVITVF